MKKLNAKFYLLLIFVFAVSALLLGFSYSKDSGVDSDVKLIEDNKNNLRIVYSTNKNLNLENKKIDLGITNLSDNKQDYVIKIVNNGTNTIYYKLDDDEQMTLKDSIIFTASLMESGKDGDYVMHTLEILNTDEFNVTVSASVVDNSLSNAIMSSANVFKDDNGNYRYYGSDVNNYIKIDNNLYRMVGIIDNKLKVVGDPINPSIYISDANYLSEEDYLLSFEDHSLNIETIVGHYSWLNSDYRYWLEESNGVVKIVDADVGVMMEAANISHYQRIVSYYDNNMKIVSGDGSLASPYEVSYGSK